MVKRLFKYNKNTILYFSLLMVCTLSACSLSRQNTTSLNEASTSAVTSIPESLVDSQGDMVIEMSAIYAELLDTYVIALNDKWDGNALMAQGLNLIALDLYDDAPLDTIGYAVMDIDGNGTDELVIGTMANVTDDFYKKIIFDLYTLGHDGALIQVFSSTARNRYFYVGGQLFVDLGSNSADDSTNTTMRYADRGLTDTGNVTDPTNYMQIKLIPLRKWADNTAKSRKNEKSNAASAELIELLDEINQKISTGTTGSYIAAVPVTVKLLNWGVGTEMTVEEIRSTVIDYMMPKGNDESVALCDNLAVVDEIYQQLIGDDAQDLLASAGCEDAPYPWSDAPIETIEAIMNAVGLR